MAMAAAWPRRQARSRAFILLLLLSGCAASRPEDGRVGFVSAVGTPLYIALKVPLCAATLIAAGPLAALERFSAAEERASAPPDTGPDRARDIAGSCGMADALPTY